MSPHRPRKRFGQHFLRDPGVIDAIVRAIRPADSDTIVEIGPGEGAITQSLAASAGALHLIELDRDLAAQLRRNFAERAHVTVHEADALQFYYSTIQGPLRVVGNLPYNISTPLLFHLLQYRNCISDMHFMLQKEVVDRMAASPGTKAYGRLGIMLGCHFNIEALFDVDPLAFEPPPEVMSSVVRLTPLPAGTYDIRDEKALSALVARAFSQRRKTIRNALKDVADVAALEAAGIDPGLRPEAVAIAAYVKLANTLE
jgi:16S rRNA (adenine1518-N6/adenine1519-N6)-dimethyltransferase